MAAEEPTRVFVALALAVVLASSLDGVAAERQGLDAPVASLLEIAAGANSFDRNRALYEFIADVDQGRLERLLAEVAGMSASPRRDDISRVLYVRYASMDPAAAADHASRARASPDVVSAVFRAWAHVDLDAAVARAAELPTSVRADAARALLQLDLPTQQREAIAEHLATRPAIAEISKPEAPPPDEAYDEALSRIGAMPDEGLRWKEARAVASAWAAADPAGALAAIIAWQSDADVKDSMLHHIMDEWSSADPRTAMDWLLASDSDPLPNMVFPAFLNLAKSNLADAEALVATIPSETARRHARMGVFLVIQDQGNLDRTLAAFEDLDARDQPMAISGLAERLARESPERAFEWFIGLDEDRKSPVVADGIRYWTLSALHRHQPARTKELIRGVADPRSRIEAARAVARLGNVGAEDLRWAESLGTEVEYAPVVGDVFLEWFGHDAQGASATLGRYPRGAARDDALDRLVGANLSAFDPQAAERLFDAIESPDKRRGAASRLHRYYTQVDPNERKAAVFRDLAADEDP